MNRSAVLSSQSAIFSAMVFLIFANPVSAQGKTPSGGQTQAFSIATATTTTTVPQRKAEAVPQAPVSSSSLFTVRVRISITPMDSSPNTESTRDTAGISLQGKGSMVDAVDRKAHWENEQIKTVVPGTPIQIKLIGVNMVSLIQLIPFEVGSSQISVVTSGQVWMVMPDGAINYRNTVNTFNIPLAERMFFFPVGYSPDGSAPLILEIIVDRSVK